MVEAYSYSTTTKSHASTDIEETGLKTQVRFFMQYVWRDSSLMPF